MAVAEFTSDLAKKPPPWITLTFNTRNPAFQDWMYKYRKPGGQFISYVMRDREGEGGGSKSVKWCRICPTFLLTFWGLNMGTFGESGHIGGLECWFQSFFVILAEEKFRTKPQSIVLRFWSQAPGQWAWVAVWTITNVDHSQDRLQDRSLVLRSSSSSSSSSVLHHHRSQRRLYPLI